MAFKPEDNRDNVQFSDNSTGYLVCSGCNGYYELQGDETPEDFEKCECGSSLTYHETIAPFENSLKFSSTNPIPDSIKTPDSIKSTNHADETADPDQYNKVEKPETLEPATASDNEFIINRFSPQKPVSDEVLNTLQQDKGNLWHNLDELGSKKDPENQKAAMDDVIEVNRLMMMVDEKRAIEENKKPSRLKSVPTKMGPIGFLSAAIVLLIVVVFLTLARGLV